MELDFTEDKLKLDIQDITNNDMLENFKCDNGSLNTYLYNNAYYEHIMGFSKTKIVRIDQKIVAYFTTKAKEITIDEGLGDKFNYPVFYLKCLAVDLTFESLGIGTSLLEYITVQCDHLSKFIGIRCLLIDALSSKTDWYNSRGFQYLDLECNINFTDVTIPMFIDFRDNDLLLEYFEE